MRLEADPRLRAVREALGGQAVWIVGGTVRDALLGRPVDDLDLAVAGDPAPVARAASRVIGGSAFRLSEEFGAWRVVAADRRFGCDITPLQGATIEEDLAKRDFSVNAMALTLEGAGPIDPHGGVADLEARVLRVLGGPSLGESAYAADPLRPLRAARLATELGFVVEPRTERLTRAAAADVSRAAPERIFAELRRIISSPRVLDGVELSGRLGLLDAVLPELGDLRGVEQSHFHHLDVYGHTLEVLREQLSLEANPSSVFGTLGEDVARVLAEPFADELTRAEALRLAALMHDIGKPATRGVLPGGRVSFIGHDSVGEQVIDRICRRLRTSERLRKFLGRITRHHLVLGFMVHERPLDRAAIYRYLTTCSPVEVEVTALSCADRLATRGKNAERAIELHLELARELMASALAWRADGPQKPPIRGDELANALGIAPGPELGALLERLAAAHYTGEARTAPEAIELARRLVAGDR
ncbi:MAG: CCA tRNA nucleotidyltransferase [Thermoleophilaceae bacterium]